LTVLWKAWSDTSRKFYLCMLLVTLLMVPDAVSTAVESARAAKASEEVTVPPGDPAEEAATSSFERQIEIWTHGAAHSIFVILAVVLGVGGTMTRANAHSNLMTLSLPMPRRRWLMGQWTVATGLLFCLCAWEALILVVTGLVAGLPVPVGRLAIATVLTAASAALWVWPSILSTSYTRDAVRAALIIVVVIVSLTTFTTLTGMLEWKLNNIANVSQWSGAIPWRPLLPGIGMTLLCAWLVIRRFERTDY
jgi:hypothetical protein